jgi:hypothetical protein
VFNTTLVLLWYLGIARMLEILETVEGVLMKGLIEIEQSIERKVNSRQFNN